MEYEDRFEEAVNVNLQDTAMRQWLIRQGISSRDHIGRSSPRQIERMIEQFYTGGIVMFRDDYRISH